MLKIDKRKRDELDEYLERSSSLKTLVKGNLVKELSLTFDLSKMEDFLEDLETFSLNASKYVSKSDSYYINYSQNLNNLTVTIVYISFNK